MGRIVLAAVATACWACQAGQGATDKSVASQPPLQASKVGAPTSVSMVQLLASPERFNGRTVRVRGVLRVGNEERGIYATEGDADHLNFASGVWLDTREEIKAQDGFVEVEGLFDAEAHGHQDLWSSSIRSVSVVRPVLKRSQYPQEMVQRPQ